jgi:uncharacterized lipoprotein YmbA
MRSGLYRLCTVLAVLVLSSACMNFGPATSPDTQYYLLTPTTGEAAPPESVNGSPRLTIGVGPVHLPEYLNRPQIVTRAGGNRIVVDEFHRWGEPLKDAVLGVVMENMAAGRGAPRVVAYPWKRSETVDARVKIDVLRFDADQNGTVTLAVRWQVFAYGAGEPAIEKRTTIPKSSGGDYDQVVGAMSAALDELAQEILSAVVNSSEP